MKPSPIPGTGIQELAPPLLLTAPAEAGAPTAKMRGEEGEGEEEVVVVVVEG